MVDSSPDSREIEVAGIVGTFVAHGLLEGQVLIQTNPGNIPALMRKLSELGQLCQDLGNGRAMVSDQAILRRFSIGSADEECRYVSYGVKLNDTTTRRIAQIQRVRERDTKAAALAL
ncbi:MAG: hypothetical protein CMK74_04025 [Pseudomonadales bacterium]|mgnify:CR=1 FL=1|nr:hypothetical protein [Pseudomonadales bacterium]